MKLAIHSLIIFCFYAGSFSSQTARILSDSTYVFWQTEQSLRFGDFRDKSPGVYAEIALWTVLDLPQGVSVLKPSQMKVYIAPVCDLNKSRANSNDSLLIAVNKVLFDILELSARAARAKLSSLPDSAISALELSNTFQTIVREMHENRLRMNRKFYREVVREKNDTDLLQWQQYLKQELQKTEQWACRPADPERFLQNRPIETGYTEDLKSNALLLNKTEQVLGRDTWHAEFCQISRYGG